MDTAVSVELFVEILNRYVYYFDQQNETVSRPPVILTIKGFANDDIQVTTKYLNGLIELIHSNLSTSASEATNANNAQQTQAMEAPKKHFYRTLDYIKSREFEGVVTEARQ